MTYSQQYLERCRDMPPSMNPEGIGIMVKDFLAQNPRHVSAKMLVEALLTLNEISPHTGVFRHSEGDESRDSLAVLHALTLSALVKAEADLQEYRNNSMGFPVMTIDREDAPCLLADEETDVTWRDYINFLTMILDSYKVCYYAVNNDRGEIESYKLRLRHRLAIALRIICLFTGYGSQVMERPHITAQIRILRSVVRTPAYSDFEHKVHIHPIISSSGLVQGDNLRNGTT